jgi:hypothetical protein
LAAGSKIHSGVQEIELLIDRSADFPNSAASRLDFSIDPLLAGTCSPRIAAC